MKLHRATRDGFVFQFNPREKTLLLEMLPLYPLVPATHHQLTRATDAQSAENQRLLEESLAEKRAENRRSIEVFLKSPRRLRKDGDYFLLKLKPGEMDWLLQVFNDIRVGSWLALGEPDETRLPQISPENFRYIISMEVCGAFESLLLAALGQSESSDWLNETN